MSKSLIKSTTVVVSMTMISRVFGFIRDMVTAHFRSEKCSKIRFLFGSVSMSKSLIKSTTVVVSMTMISRVFGFIRDMVTAHFFGAAAQFDAFSMAFRIPNFMRRLFAEGAFSQAFVPVLSEYQKTRSQEEMKRFIDAMTGSLGIALILFTLMGMIFAPVIVRIFAPGFETDGP